MFNEEKLSQLLYTDCIYSKFGISFCLTYEVALAKIGTEAVCESLYSVLQTN